MTTAAKLSYAQAKFQLSLGRLMTPPEPLTVAEWLEANIFIPPGNGEAKPGQLNFMGAGTPYLIEILNSLTDPAVRDIILMSATRVGKTMALRCASWWAIGCEPSPLLWVSATHRNGCRVSQKELIPVINFNKVLRDRKPTCRHHFTTDKHLYPAGAHEIVGSNSRANLAGVTVRVVIGDETDKWPTDNGVEAGSVELARQRTGTEENEAKHFFASSPSTEDGPINVWYEKGDKRKWYITCPCGNEHALQWGSEKSIYGVKWDESTKNENGWDVEAASKSAWYHCANSECSIRHGQKGLNQMKLAGRWIATAKPKLPGVRSYHLTGLAGPLQKNSMEALVQGFLESDGTGFVNLKKDFWNSAMGEPWRDSFTATTLDKLNHLYRDYEGGTTVFPPGFRCDKIILSYDVQTWGMPYVVRAYSFRQAESYLIAFGTAASWSQLQEFQEEYGAQHVIGDCNFEDRRAEQFKATQERAPLGWCLAEGFKIAKDIVEPSWANAFIGGKEQADGKRIRKLKISLYHIKIELEKRILGEVKNWGVYTPTDDEEKKELAEYFTQLLNERRFLKKKIKPGELQYEFRQKGPNHYFDCEVYGLALFRYLQEAFATKSQRKANTSNGPRVIGNLNDNN